MADATAKATTTRCPISWLWRAALCGRICETGYLATPGPFFLDVRVTADENCFPMIPPGCGHHAVLLGKNRPYIDDPGKVSKHRAATQSTLMRAAGITPRQRNTCACTWSANCRDEPPMT